VIFVETSAFVECLLDAPETDRLVTAMKFGNTAFTGAHVRLETCMVLSNRLNISPEDANTRFDLMLADVGIIVEPLTDEISRVAVQAFSTYGKGRKHKAQLNLADCLSYAFAKSKNLRLLYVGDDFSHTDIRAA
jgi:ribonuclease VapC